MTDLVIAMGEQYVAFKYEMFLGIINRSQHSKHV